MTVSTACSRSGISLVSGTTYGIRGVGDLSLRPHEPLRHRRRRDEERARDLLGLEADERAKRERDLRLERERRVAAGEDEAKAVVGDLRRRRPARRSSPRDRRRRSRACPRAPCFRRMRSIAMCRAVWMSQARGCSGTPSSRQRPSAASKASWVASSATSKSPVRRMTVARMRPHSER